MSKTKRLTLCAILIALALALSYTERFIPLQMVIPLPGVKLGLANIVTLIALYLSSAIDKMHLAPLLVAILSLVLSMVISTVLSGFLIRHFVHPLNALTAATKRVAAGDFSQPIEEEDVGHPRRILNSTELGVLIRSFNEMMRELNGLEIFRRDFISNFSHEFKTPILSIRGFARQLEEGELTPQQHADYDEKASAYFIYNAIVPFNSIKGTG